MKIALIIAGSLAALVVLAAAWGALLPAEHTATREARLAAPPDRVYGLLTDVAAFPEWRADVREVEILSTEPLRFRERGKHGDILFEEVERVRAERLVIRIADAELPFGGQWTYTLRADGDATRLRIREDGVVRNVVFRFMARFVIGHTATIDAYLQALDKRLSQSRS